MGAAFGIGFILGPAIGGLLGRFRSARAVLRSRRIALANAHARALCAAGVAAAARAPAVPLGAGPTRSARCARCASTLRRWLLGALFLWQLGHQVLPSTWAFYTISKFHWSSAEVGHSLAFVGTLMAIAQGLLTRV